MSFLIGVDVGATTISAGLVRRDGEIVSVTQRPTHDARRNSVVDTVIGLVCDLVSETRARGISVDGVGIGLPGLVDATTGEMIDGGNLVPEFAHVPLAYMLRAATGLPVFVDNDANVLALAERAFGVARAASSFALVAIGTGLGGAAMIGDMLVRGHAGCAGEFGHIPVKLDGPECLCGRRGCVGAWVGGQVIAARARARLAAADASSLRDLAGGEPSRVDARLVFEAARAGDPLAREIAREACAALGAGLAAIMHALNPEMIVVTGGVAVSLVPLEAELRVCVARHALARALATTRLQIVPADKRRTVAGGAALVLYELDNARASAAPRAVTDEVRS